MQGHEEESLESELRAAGYEAHWGFGQPRQPRHLLPDLGHHIFRCLIAPEAHMAEATRRPAANAPSSPPLEMAR
jgi:hypothetical protein